MNISQGLYRIAQLIKWSGRVITSFYFVFFGYTIIFIEKKWGNDILLVGGLFILFIAITEGIAWAIEGFSGE